MRLRLNKNEVARAVQIYLGAKLGAPPDSLHVRMLWRSECAEVETPRAIPTLTVAVIAGDK